MESRQLYLMRPARRRSIGSSTKSCAAGSSNPNQRRSFSPRSISYDLRAPTASYWAARKLASPHSTPPKYTLTPRSILRFATTSNHSYYESDLAWDHHVGYSHHAERMGPEWWRYCAKVGSRPAPASWMSAVAAACWRASCAPRALRREAWTHRRQ